MSRRLSVVALGVLIVGLALHNLAMATLWDWGVRGNALDVVAAWKEALLAIALGAALWHARRLPPLRAADLLAAEYAGIVLLYAVIPQDWLDGAATTRGELLALRHHLTPVAAYALGRLLVVTVRERRALLWLAVGVGGALALWGLADAYLVPLQWWRDAGGAVLTMLADTMMPEAFQHGGRLTGVVTTFGFAVAFALSVLE